LFSANRPPIMPRMELIPIDPGARRAILDAVDAQRAEAEALLADLVRFPSTLGHEAWCLDYCARAFADLGLEVRRIPTDIAALSAHPGWSPPLLAYDGRDNVAALHRPRATQGRSLCLQGHVDVVPEGAAELWTTPPFDPDIRGGRMYGRGAGDMKAGIASNIFALKALHAAGLQPAADLQLHAVIEEECTGNGALACMVAMPKPDAVVIPEPFDHALLVAEVGVIWAWVTVTGRPAHVLEMQKGVNAIEAATALAARFKQYEARMNEAALRHPAFAGHNHPINVNLGTIEGGEWNSSVPTRAKIGLRIGVMPGYPAARARADIEALVADAAQDAAFEGCGLSLSFKGFFAEGCVFDPQWPIMRALDRFHADIRGAPARHLANTGLTDARFWPLYQGTPATCYGPEAERIHGIDESVSLASMHDVTRVLALTIAGWCGLEAVS
jgi:acetylornithine deacetylase